MLKDTLDRLASFGSGMDVHGIQMYPGLCARARHRGSTCTHCAELCPERAITLGKELAADPQRCTGCRICTVACPTGAFTGVAPSLVGLLNYLERLSTAGTTVAFACPRTIAAIPGGDDSCIAIPCLGMVDVTLLVGAVSLGVQAVWLLDAGCSHEGVACGWQAGRLVARHTAQEANRLLTAWTGKPHVFMASALPAGTEPVARPVSPDVMISRRRLLTFMAAPPPTVRNVFTEPPQPAANPAPSGKGSPPRAYVPGNREILLVALRRLGKPASSGCIETGIFADFGYDDQCTGCQMCAYFCPTGALRKVEQDGKPGLAFRPALCTNCGLCRDICYRQAVILKPAVDLQAIFSDRQTVYWVKPDAARTLLIKD